MPDPTLSEAWQEAVACAPTTSRMLHTLEFRHPLFTAPARVVRDTQDWTLTLEPGAPANPGAPVPFVRCAFDFDAAGVSEAGSPEFRIALDNVSRVISEELRRARGSLARIDLTYRGYLSDRTGVPQAGPYHLEVADISVDVFRVLATARMPGISHRAFPRLVYDAAQWPTLRT